MGNYFLHYGPFVISGIDTFIENAEGIKFIGGDDMFELYKHDFFQRQDVQDLLKILDD
jgi:hypothetical protein